MGINWSDDQKKVIDLRDRDILVSAAAGSGKTTVLVERIIQMITDSNNPVDIDQLLVVTFTKAAAAEMKQRITKALDELVENTEDEELKYRLHRQSALVQHSMITTIDSFCLFVVKNYFEEIDLDPNFSLADENEGKLLVQDMALEVFEENYKREDNAAFLNLIDHYSGTRSDKNVRDIVIQLYNKSLSSSWPKKWLDGVATSCAMIAEKTEEDFPAVQKIVEMANSYVNSWYTKEKKALEICSTTAGLEPYMDAFLSEIAQLEAGLEIYGYSEFQKFLLGIQPQRFKSAKTGADEFKKQAVANVHKSFKTELEHLQSKYFNKSWEEICEEQSKMTPLVNELVRLAKELYDAVAAYKTKNHLIDFSDMEHFALRILVDEETNEPRPVAEDFRKHFKEIMIDEYQDSNEVQETILKAISKEPEGKHNMFMVGDVKQSIYRFRMAKPDLFVGKYETFSKKDSSQQRIDLSENYRSRKDVLEFSNVLFENLMDKSLGGIVYDESARLNAAAKYDETNESCAEVLIADYKSIKEEASETEDLKKAEVEAIAVAHRILELKESMVIKEKIKVDGEEVEVKRPLRNSDIVILMRSIKTTGPIFQEVLQSYGIKAHVNSTTGYFSAPEVALILNVLRLVDNPLQDIPMAAALVSPLVGYTNEDLAEIHMEINEEHNSFAKAALYHMEANEEPFKRLLDELRSRKDLAIHEMLQLIYSRTGYDSYVAALPAGEIRYANLEMLVSKAIKFEQTNYKGVFHFLRYINQMQKYDQDFGEADTEGESGDVVHIMTIHKSKGLEFPVVFLSNASKAFNTEDLKGDYIIHSDLGLGLKLIEGSPRVKSDTFVYNAIRNYEKLEMLGEELRVLYVALTRAKEKIIVTGSEMPKNLDSAGALSFDQKISSKNYLDWIVPVLYASGLSEIVKEVDFDYISLESELQRIETALSYESVLANIKAADEEKLSAIKEELSYEYQYQKDISKKAKYSVSDIKHREMGIRLAEKHDGGEVPDFAGDHWEEYVPSFATAQEKSKNGEIVFDPYAGIPAGALFGTAVHRVMEVLDFAAFDAVPDAEEDIRAFADAEMKRICENGLLEPALAKRLHGRELETFLHSKVARRMAKADAIGELYREKPFVMEWEDKTLMQGIIDVFWREEDGIVLLDYKTDKVEEAEELVLRYEAQLDLYEQALQKIFGTVKEKLIYSYRLKETINL